jgi:hypothetical protein
MPCSARPSTTLRKAVAAALYDQPNPLDAIREFPVEDRGEIKHSKLGWLLRKNTNRIIGRFEFQQAKADGRNAWRVVEVKTPVSPAFTPPVAETVTSWSGRL